MVNIYLHTHPILYIKFLIRALSRLSKKYIIKLCDYTLPILFSLYLLFLAYILPGAHQYVIPN